MKRKNDIITLNFFIFKSSFNLQPLSQLAFFERTHSQAIFTLWASRSNNLCYDEIVIAGEAWRSHDDSPKAWDCHIASLLATTSAAISTRE